jgi:rhamnogalacturonyl hydrolase YesR
MPLRRWTSHLVAAAVAISAVAATAQVPRPAPASADAAARKPSARAVMASLRRVADWQLANRDYLYNRPKPLPGTHKVRDWQQGTFWVGLTELADRDPRYVAPIMATGRAEGWRMWDWAFFADDQLIGQVWNWASKRGAGKAALAPAKTYYDNLFANRPTNDLIFDLTNYKGGQIPCTKRWCWADALFMGPATMLRLGKSLNDPRYADYVHEEFKANADLLFDKQDKLFFRDSRFLERRDEKGRKLFWSRGNGWALAGIARAIDSLDRSDPKRPYYVDLYRKMAARIVQLQKADGYWHVSLLDNDAGTPPETSGTGFHVYSLAWGLNNGLLKGPQYERAVLRGWDALERAVQPSGMLGWVQQVGDRPTDVKQDDTQFFGTGAYLLAGTAVYDLAKRRNW